MRCSCRTLESGVSQRVQPPTVTTPDPVVDAQIAAGQAGGSPHGQVERGVARLTCVGADVEQQGEVDRPLVGVLPDEQLLVLGRGAPVDVAAPVAGGERPHAAELDAGAQAPGSGAHRGGPAARGARAALATVPPPG